MRLALAALLLSLTATSTSFAGPRDPDAPPPTLYDDADALPTAAQAVQAAHAFLRTLPGGAPEKVAPTLTIPLLADAGCENGPRFVDEAEGLPGTPTCLIDALGNKARRLDKAVTKKSVFKNLAAVERRLGKLTASDQRDQVAALVHHRLVAIKKAGVRLVIAVRLDGGEPRVDVVLVD